MQVSLQFMPFMGEPDYARRAGLPGETILDADRIEGGAPIMVGALEPGFYDPAPLAYDFPAVTVTTYRDAVVRGASNVISTADGVVRHGLMELGSEMMPEEFHSRLILRRERGEAGWTPCDPFGVGWLPEAASFVDAAAPNYAHWITEVLPRIAAFARDPARRKIPFVIDAGLHANMLRTVRMVAGADVTLVELAPDEVLRVGVLHNVSPAGYAPYKLRPGLEGDFSHGAFGGRALAGMVETLRQAAGVQAGGARPRLFIRRNTKLRRLVNEAEIEAALVARGFQVLEPERLTADEQVAAYSGAGMVVGATGAGVVNLAFCRPDCPTVVLMPRFRLTAYWYWRRIAAAAGAGPVVHAVGLQEKVLDDPFDPLALHQDYRVEVKDVLEAVERAEALAA
ncbi:glycosyltransferase family 61 protein [Phenylobacterium zucineum]|nr:glycosyltransferase family 61 protein [Phenylobacterium zucineum]